MAAAAQRASSSVVSCSRQSTVGAVVRAAPISRRQSHVVRAAEVRVWSSWLLDPQAYQGLHCGSGAFLTSIGQCNYDVDMLCVNVEDNAGQQQNSSSSVTTFQQTARLLVSSACMQQSDV